VFETLWDVSEANKQFSALVRAFGFFTNHKFPVGNIREPSRSYLWSPQIQHPWPQYRPQIHRTASTSWPLGTTEITSMMYKLGPQGGDDMIVDQGHASTSPCVPIQVALFRLWTRRPFSLGLRATMSRITTDPDNCSYNASSRSHYDRRASPGGPMSPIEQLVPRVK
jgi:hypothetical protein